MPKVAMRVVDVYRFIATAVRGWLSKAANDLRGARIDLAADPPLIEDALFHCRQAAEKSLKAVMAPRGRTTA